MLSIATLFDDEQRLLNRVWIVLLGLEALLVVFSVVSAIVRRVVARRHRRRVRGGGGGNVGGSPRRGVLRNGHGRWSTQPSDHDHQTRPRHVTIQLPAAVFDAYDEQPLHGDGGYFDEDHYDHYDHYEYDYEYDDDDAFMTEKSSMARTSAHGLNSPSFKV